MAIRAAAIARITRMVPGRSAVGLPAGRTFPGAEMARRPGTPSSAVRAFVLSAALLLPACKGCKTEVADDTGALSIVPVEVYEGAVTANSTVAADAALKAPGEITGYVLVP